MNHEHSNRMINHLTHIRPHVLLYRDVVSYALWRIDHRRECDNLNRTIFRWNDHRKEQNRQRFSQESMEVERIEVKRHWNQRENNDAELEQRQILIPNPSTETKKQQLQKTFGAGMQVAAEIDSSAMRYEVERKEVEFEFELESVIVTSISR